MANQNSVWYCSSAGWTAVTAWPTSTAVSAGVLRRQSATPTVGNERVFACIVAGTTNSTEPSWTVTKGAKTTDNTVTWQECTGQPGVNGDSTNCPKWAASTAYALGQVIQGVTNSVAFICSTAGTSGSSEPTWSSTAGQTTTDNTVTWTSLGNLSGFGAFAGPHARLTNAHATNWMAAGDTLYVGNDHAETQSTAITLANSSSTTLLSSSICVDHLKAAPYASGDLKTGATVTTTGNSDLNMSNGGYYDGIAFSAGTGANTAVLAVSTNSQSTNYIFQNCALQVASTSASTGKIKMGLAATQMGLIRLVNTTVQFGNTGDGLTIRVPFEWYDTASAITGASVPTILFVRGADRCGSIYCDSVDLSACTGTFIGTASAALTGTFNRCKLGSGYTYGGTGIAHGTRIDFVQCDSGATNHFNARVADTGAHTINATIVRTGGASDGTTPISWAVTTSSTATFADRFQCQPIVSDWNSTTGSSKTITIYGIINAAAVPNNDDIWLSMEYLGASSSPLGSFATSRKTNLFATGTAYSADTSAWDSAATARANSHTYSTGDIIKTSSNAGRIFFCTTGGTSASSEPGGYATAVDGGSVTDGTATFRAGSRFIMTASGTPQLAGFIYAFVRAGKASTTWYIDPVAYIS